MGVFAWSGDGGADHEERSVVAELTQLRTLGGCFDDCESSLSFSGDSEAVLTPRANADGSVWDRIQPWKR